MALASKNKKKMDDKHTLEYEQNFFTFSGIESAKLSDSDVVVLPVPYDSTQSYKSGAREGPFAIIRASMDMETYDIELDAEITDFIKIHTANSMFSDYSSPESMISKIKDVILQIISLEKFPVMIGGEHSVTLGAVQAFKDKYKELTVLSIDAHADLRDDYGSKFSHACVLRRSHELGCTVIPVGVRSISEEESKFVKSNKIPVFYGRFDESKINEILSHCGKDVYLTIDVDGFDPSIMPGTGTPEPNGLLWEPTLKLIKKLFETKNVVGMDVVEVHPMHVTTVSEDNAARLILKSLIYKFKKRVK